MSVDGRLAGRRILVTGASSGIGQAVADLFASEGARLLLVDMNPLPVAAAKTRPSTFVAQCDVTEEVSVAKAVAEGAEALGGLDGIVNCAGIQVRGSVFDVGLEQWRRSLEVNLTGPYIVVRACLPWLLRNDAATIVNIGSGQSLLPNAPERTAYAASKGGVLNLTRALAAELAPRIRANTVCPGLVDTPMAQGVTANTGNYALKRMAQPVEIARAVLFLTSEESSYVTGAALAVDGGRSFH